MEDDEIIRLFYERSENAIVHVEKKYGAILGSMAYRILHDYADAEEVVNDTLYAAWETIPPENPNPLLAYLVRIAHNKSIKKYHKNTAKKRNSYYDVALDELEAVLSDADADSPEEKYEARELAEAMDRFLDKIDKRGRLLFVRRYYFSDSLHELSKKFGMSENSVSVKFHRIRKRLRKYLEKEGFLYE
ncbi:MAG: sigma-70 family RNA polymerase sigma factor [Lachnospiraceae bacterium]|nr:sigma-70 family RNA polymerase sigma factor [Lachnospiraceae bacterium]